mgnify:CR=1 FL=1
MKRSPLFEAQAMYERVSKMEDPDTELTNEEKDEILGRTGQILRDVVILSYGEKSEDGKRFIKDDYRLGREFVETKAYEAFYMEMISNPKAFFDFIKAVIPAEAAKNIEEPAIPMVNKG